MFGEALYNELHQLPGVSPPQEEIEPIIDLSMLENISSADLDSPLIDDSNSFSLEQSHSDDPIQDIDPAPHSPVDKEKARFLFTKGMTAHRFAALPDEHVVIFSSKTDETNGRTLIFSIVRQKNSCYLGWFVDTTSITGIGYLFYSNGCYYRGEFSNGEKNGYGELYYENGTQYNGYWKQNNKQGSGQFVFSNVFFYIGKWENIKLINCSLKCFSPICTKEQVLLFMNSNNDYIFFKQRKLSSDHRRMILRYQQFEHGPIEHHSRFPGCIALF